MSLKLNSSGGGSVTLQEPTTASNFTVNLPAVTGTMLTTASAGTVLQVVSTAKTDTFTTTSTSLIDVTGLSVTITPTSASNKILILSYVTASTTASSFASIVLVRNSTQIFNGDAAGIRPLATGMFYTEGNQGVIWAGSPIFLDSPATTSAITYKIQARVGSGGGTFVINRSARDDNFSTYDFRTPSSITVMEIAG